MTLFGLFENERKQKKRKWKEKGTRNEKEKKRFTLFLGSAIHV